jgi:hypothetical protein
VEPIAEVSVFISAIELKDYLLKVLTGTPWRNFLISRGVPTDAQLPIPSTDVVDLCDKHGAPVDMKDAQIIMHHYFQWDNKGNRGRFKPNQSVTMVLRLDYAWFQNFESECESLLGIGDVMRGHSGRPQRKRKWASNKTEEDSASDDVENDEV